MPVVRGATTSPVTRTLAVALLGGHLLLLQTPRATAQPADRDYAWHRVIRDTESLLTPIRPLPLPPFTGLAATPMTPWDGPLRLAHGEAALRLRRYAPAITEFRRLHRDSPVNGISPARSSIGEGIAEFQRESYDRVRMYMTEAIREADLYERREASGTAGEALYWIAASHLADRSQPLGKSAGLLNEVLQRHPEHRRSADAQYLLGLIAEAEADLSAAIEHYREVLKLSPQHWDTFSIRLRQTQCAIVLDDTAAAERQLESLRTEAGEGQEVRPDSGYYAYQLLRGEFELSRGRHADAEGAFIALMSTDITEFRRRGMLGLADTYLAAGQVDSALAINRRLVDANSSDQTGEQASYNVAIALAALGDEAGSENRLREIATIPGHIRRDEALFNLALLRYRRGDYDTAHIRLREGLVAEGAPALRRRTHTLMGALLLRQGEYAEAATHLEADPTAAGATLTRFNDHVRRYLLAIALVRSGRAPEAVPMLIDLEGTWNGDEGQGVLYWLGEAYYESRLYPASAEALERLLTDAPSSPYAEPALYTIGWAHLRQRNFDRAEFAFARMLKAYPTTPRSIEAGLRRGDCLYALGRYAEAAEAYLDALRPGTTGDQRLYADYQRVVALRRSGARFDAYLAAIRFQTCHPQSPLVPDAAYIQGITALEAGQARSAESALLRAVGNGERTEVHERALAELAKLYASRREARRALAAASLLADEGSSPNGRRAGEDLLVAFSRSFGEEGAAIDPRDPIDRGALQEGAGDIDGALRSYRRATEQPGNEAYATLAELVAARAVMSRDRPQAEALIADVVDRRLAGGLPAPAAISAAQLALDLGDTLRAGAVVDSLASWTLTPSQRHAAASLARDAGRARTGLQILDSRTRDSTVTIPLLSRLLRIDLLLDLDRPAEAEAALAEIDVEREGGGDEVVLARARARRAAHDAVEARRLLEDLLKHPVWLTQTRRSALVMLADLYRQAGETPRADALLAALSRERCNEEAHTPSAPRGRTDESPSDDQR